MKNQMDAQRSELFGRIITRIVMGVERDLAGSDADGLRVTRAQKSVLFQLETRGNRITTLAARLGISKQAVSKLVQELETNDLVERAPDPKDKRATVIRFTKEGQQLVENTIQRLKSFEMSFAEEIGDEDLALVKAKLKQIAALVDPHGF